MYFTAEVQFTPVPTNPIFLEHYGSTVQIPNMAAIDRLPHSVTRTATNGSCRKLQRGCPAVSIPQLRPSLQRMTWRAHFGGLRLLMGSTKNGRGSATTIGLS